MWLLFWITNIIDNIIWDPTSDIRAKVRVEAMAAKESKTSGIEKFDGTDFGVLEDADWRLSLWEEIASTSFGDETWNYERWRLEPSW